jgi:hypothetical protein
MFQRRAPPRSVVCTVPIRAGPAQSGSSAVDGLRRDRDASIFDDTVTFRCLHPVWLFCIGLVSIACGSDSDAGAPAGGGGNAASPGGASQGGIAASELPYQPCPAETEVGEFTIELGAGFTSFDGKVLDGVKASDVPSELARDGECRLVSLPRFVCAPACPSSTQTCGENNQCVPLPVAHDVGTVTVSGLARALAMTANDNTGNYVPGPPALPHPGFAPGADLRLAASGGDYEPFELRGWGISAFETPPDPVPVTGGQPVAVTWTAPTEPGPARVYAKLNVNNHGSSDTWIECDFEDTGAATIPASLVDGLIAQGASGFPTLTLARRTASSTSIMPGCVQLIVKSEVDLDVTLAGLVSCADDDSVCPTGQTCKPIERYCF